jgi:hypothetical protein
VIAILIVPLVVLVAGVLIFFTAGNPKIVTVGQILFLCGFFIFLWLVTVRASLPLLHW